LLVPVIVPGALAVGAAVLWTGGAFGSSPTSDTLTENRSVPREGAQRTNLCLHLGAGVLSVQGGATGLVDAEFISNMPDLDPDFVHRVTGGVGEVSITQPSNLFPVPAAHMRYEWHVRCADGIHVDKAIGGTKARGFVQNGRDYINYTSDVTQDSTSTSRSASGK
jgi:hypothetical protein